MHGELESLNRGRSLPNTPSITLGLALLVAGCAPQPRAADLVLRGGNIVTLEEGQPPAQALAARDGRIVFVGSDENAEVWIGADTEVIDLAGQMAIPGFIEGHGHFFGIGQGKLQLDLAGARTWDEIVEMVAAAAAASAEGQWILGRGWHQSKWDGPPEPSVQALPVHASLSAASPANPVLLTHASGHAAFVNAKALELAGIDRDTPDPPGGEVVKDALGEPTGMLRETAEELVMSALSRDRDELEWNTARRVVELAGEDCLSKGVTSFQDAGSSFELIEIYRRLADEGALPVRLWVMARAHNETLASGLARHRTVGHGKGFLTVRGIKKSIDGALGPHGAWLLEPYTDKPDTSGLNTTSVEEVEGAARLALEHDYQLCVHAIGDRANRETLDIFERAFREAGVEGRSLRWRIEHAQHLHPQDIPRFASLGVIASMQGVHATSDGPWVPSRIGEERAREGAYVWRKLLDAGVRVSNGTDAPVEDVDPLASFRASVYRRMPDGRQFYPEQSMTRREALESYTIGAARAAFEEDVKGTLAVGKYADVTVLSHDILTVPEEELAEARVVYTIVAGRVRYRDEGGTSE
ncbi:MAG TPA: amidohydrolase [Thermoanaerobaculia bacterium]|nr:amidohydrolase [Thermoanaerobaculia bacterium]